MHLEQLHGSLLRVASLACVTHPSAVIVSHLCLLSELCVHFCGNAAYISSKRGVLSSCLDGTQNAGIRALKNCRVVDP